MDLGLTDNQLLEDCQALIRFFNFSFFGERDVDDIVGFTYAIEQLACVHKLDQIEVDSSELMELYAEELDRVGLASNNANWLLIRDILPYVRATKLGTSK